MKKFLLLIVAVFICTGLIYAQNNGTTNQEGGNASSQNIATANQTGNLNDFMIHQKIVPHTGDADNVIDLDQSGIDNDAWLDQTQFDAFAGSANNYLRVEQIGNLNDATATIQAYSGHNNQIYQNGSQNEAFLTVNRNANVTMIKQVSGAFSAYALQDISALMGVATIEQFDGNNNDARQYMGINGGQPVGQGNNLFIQQNGGTNNQAAQRVYFSADALVGGFSQNIFNTGVIYQNAGSNSVATQLFGRDATVDDDLATYNTSTIVQTNATNSSAWSRQVGDYNVAVQNQSNGNNITSTVMQLGDYNNANILQTGSNNHHTLNQTGDYNVDVVVQVTP